MIAFSVRGPPGAPREDGAVGEKGGREGGRRAEGGRSEGQRADGMRRGGVGGAQRASYMGGKPQTKSSVSSAGGKQYFWILALSIQPNRCVAGAGVGKGGVGGDSRRRH